MSISLEYLPPKAPRDPSSPRRPSIPPSIITASMSRTINLFLNLPPEIHLEILNHLHYPTILSLRAVNRYFHALLTPSVLSRTRTVYVEYLHGFAYSPFHSPAAPCFTCLRIRDRPFFDARNWDLETPFMHHRMCIECRIRTVAYSRGEIFWWQADLTRCGGCGEIKPRVRCTNKLGGICRQCDDWHLARKTCRRLWLWTRLAFHFLFQSLGLIVLWPIRAILRVLRVNVVFYVVIATNAVISASLLVWPIRLLAKYDPQIRGTVVWAMVNATGTLSVSVAYCIYYIAYHRYRRSFRLLDVWLLVFETALIISWANLTWDGWTAWEDEKDRSAGSTALLISISLAFISNILMRLGRSQHAGLLGR